MSVLNQFTCESFLGFLFVRIRGPESRLGLAFMLHLIENSSLDVAVCRSMGRWRCAGVVALVLLLSAASHGRGVVRQFTVFMLCY